MVKIWQTIFQAIQAGKWVKIAYLNQNNKESIFWIAVYDITFDEENPRIKCYLYNPHENPDSSLISFGEGLFLSKISNATIIDFSHYDVPDSLHEKIDKNMGKYSWLDYETDIKYLLDYYEVCNRYDNDPYQKATDITLVEGIDFSVLNREKEYKLNKEQKEKILKIFEQHQKEKNELKYEELILSQYSIDKGDRHYILCYYDVMFNPQKGCLCLGNVRRFNKSFLHKKYLEKNISIDSGKSTLYQYTEMNVDEFIELFQNNEQEGIEIIESNLRNGEILNTRPEFTILKRDIQIDVKTTYETILERVKANKLNVPLKSFLGRRTGYDNRKIEPKIIICDEKINVDQTRVLYNTMKQPVTFVQGPPGTGKTQTILNVILNGFYNDKTMLICSSNNKPIDGIIEKMTFKYKNEKIPFPYIRLGNRDVVKHATLQIRNLFKYRSKYIPDDLKMTKIKESTDVKNEKLRELLMQQEIFVETEDHLRNSQKLLKYFDKSKHQIVENIKQNIIKLSQKLVEYPEVKNKDILSLFTPLNEDYKLQELFYFQSLKCIKSLQKSTFNDLKEICEIKDDSQRANEFNRWLADDNNMKRFKKVFPIIFTTNISSQRLGTPNTMFDIVIMDEAGQCNIAHSLIPITKADTLLLVGDPCQLKPIVTLEDSINEMFKKKYSIPENYDYKHYSILEVMRNHDSISRYVLLKYHYRCARKIIDFSNQKYYEKSLNLSAIKDSGELISMPIKNKNIVEKNSAYDEAIAIVDFIKRNSYRDVSIITPFVNQKKLINALLQRENITDITCETVHAIQGGEKSTIIMSTALSTKTSQRTFEWIKNNRELINVAVTRAKRRLIIANDDEVLKALANNTKCDLFDLIQYVKNNGKISIPQNEQRQVEIGKSNGSFYEAEFFTTISQFCTVHTSFEVKRNVSFSKIFADDEELSKLDNEFDCVLYEKRNKRLIPKIVIEINGGEHFGDKKRELSDVKKSEICKAKGWKLLMIPNSFVKNYTQLCKIINESKDIVDTQKSFVFEEFEEDNKSNSKTIQAKKGKIETQKIRKSKHEGYCIRCGKEISYYTLAPYCRICYYEWNRYGGYEYYSEKYCHRCGTISYGICFERPECKSCYYK